jgi:hypothetical protein
MARSAASPRSRRQTLTCGWLAVLEVQVARPEYSAIVRVTGSARTVPLRLYGDPAEVSWAVDGPPPAGGRPLKPWCPRETDRLARRPTFQMSNKTHAAAARNAS